jgi:hypothetical protein
MSLYENIHKKRRRIKGGSGGEKKCIQTKNRCNRNLVIARYIGL